MRVPHFQLSGAQWVVTGIFAAIIVVEFLSGNTVAGVVMIGTAGIGLALSRAYFAWRRRAPQ